MDSVYALRLSRAANSAEPGGDFIDYGWSLLKALDAAGFDVVPRREALTSVFAREGRSLNEMAGLRRQVEGGSHVPSK